MLELDYVGSSADKRLLSNLTTRSVEFGIKAQKSLDNRKKADAASSKLSSLKNNKAIAEKCEVRLKKNVDRIDSYLAKKKGDGVRNIKTGMLAARAIIPHGTPVHLVYEPGDVYLAGDDGLAINETDGSGFRATLSLFMRERLLKSTDCLQNMVLDEPLTTLDLENSAEMSKYISAMAMTAPVVLIEQKPEVFVSTPHIAYIFELVNGITRVRKERVNGDNFS